jgi:hypothetical protein
MSEEYEQGRRDTEAEIVEYLRRHGDGCELAAGYRFAESSNVQRYVVASQALHAAADAIESREYTEAGS